MKKSRRSPGCGWRIWSPDEPGYDLPTYALLYLLQPLDRTQFCFRTPVETGAPFPLTPALSLREREAPGSAVGDSGSRPPCGAIRFAPGGAIILPLLKGEGRGEGERVVRTVCVSRI